MQESVTDPSGSGVPGAAVTIIDIATDARLSVKTNTLGEYTNNKTEGR